MKTITLILSGIAAISVGVILITTSTQSNIGKQCSPQIDSAKFYSSKLPIRAMDDLGHIHNKLDTVMVEELDAVYYKAQCLENGTITYIVGMQPTAIKETLYKPLDTVWLNPGTHLIDDVDTNTMRYVIRSIAH